MENDIIIGVDLNPLLSIGYAEIYHFTPLHYLAFIARSGALFSKSELLKQGFVHSHFRAKSKKQDLERGFKGKVHLTTSPMPPILNAKLEAGFPHVGLRVESARLDGKQFDLCRFNVAMTRQLRRGNHAGHKTGPENGEYYDGIQLPIARSDEEKLTLLVAAKGTDRMVEVLVDGSFDLDEDTVVIAFNEQDAEKRLTFLGKSRVLGRLYWKNKKFTPRSRGISKRAQNSWLMLLIHQVGEAMASNLIRFDYDIVIEWSCWNWDVHGDLQINFQGFEPLGADDMRVLQGLVAQTLYNPTCFRANVLPC